MNVELTADQREFDQRAIESGRFTSEEEAVREALELWEERERRRLEILAMLDEANASLARGEGNSIHSRVREGPYGRSQGASPSSNCVGR